jgi:hypothetical protein
MSAGEFRELVRPLLFSVRSQGLLAGFPLVSMLRGLLPEDAEKVRKLWSRPASDASKCRSTRLARWKATPFCNAASAAWRLSEQAQLVLAWGPDDNHDTGRRKQGNSNAQ